MANEDHLAILRKGVEAWNQWRIDNETVRPDLIEAEVCTREPSPAPSVHPKKMHFYQIHRFRSRIICFFSSIKTSNLPINIPKGPLRAW